MIRLRRYKHEMPQLNTASLPDLIFSVLFFFIIVTHIREVTVKVKYAVPAGTELTKLARKHTVTHIYIGRPVNALGQVTGDRTCVQVNDKVATVGEVADFVARERSGMSEEDAPKMTVSLKADKNTDMGTVTDVKQALRKAGALKISYSAVDNGDKKGK